MEQKEFRSVGKQYKKIAGKRYRLPRKVKKRFKTNMCKHGFEIKKLKFSYKRLNIDVVGHQNTKWAYLKDKLNEYETAYEKSKNK
jgi:hypothetical protein